MTFQNSLLAPLLSEALSRDFCPTNYPNHLFHLAGHCAYQSVKQDKNMSVAMWSKLQSSQEDGLLKHDQTGQWTTWAKQTNLPKHVSTLPVWCWLSQASLQTAPKVQKWKCLCPPQWLCDLFKLIAPNFATCKVRSGIAPVTLPHTREFASNI